MRCIPLLDAANDRGRLGRGTCGCRIAIAFGRGAGQGPGRACCQICAAVFFELDVFRPLRRPAELRYQVAKTNLNLLKIKASRLVAYRLRGRSINIFNS